MSDQVKRGPRQVAQSDTGLDPQGNDLGGKWDPAAGAPKDHPGVGGSYEGVGPGVKPSTGGVVNPSSPFKVGGGS